MKNLEFDFVPNPIPERERMLAIVDSYYKAYVFLNEQLLRARKSQIERAISYSGADLGKVPVLDFTMEVSGDEMKFLYDAAKKHYMDTY